MPAENFIAAPDFCDFSSRKEIITQPMEKGESAHWKLFLVYKPDSQAGSNWLANHSSLESEPLGFLSKLFENGGNGIWP